MTSSKFNTKEEVKAARRATQLAMPLLVLLIPLMIVNVVVELVWTLVVMVWPFGQGPDAKGVHGATPVPVKRKYVGEIIGFFRYLKDWGQPYIPLFATGPGGDTSSRVWVDNAGLPVVSCMDATSTEPLVVDYDCRKDKRIQYPFIACIESTKPNFYRSGDRAVQFRSLVIDMVPRSENDEQFKVAIDGMKAAAKRWIDNTDGPGDITDFCTTLLTAWSSTLLLGDEVPLELMQQISLMPFDNLYYPRFWPAWLLPNYWGMLKAREYLHARAMASPRWPKILSKATEVGLTPSDACDALVPIVGFNVLGFMNSLSIAIDFLPGMNFGEELVKDTKKLESFALETLRFSGPVAIMPAKDEPTIIKTSAGATHAVKKGTLLSTMLETAQMDPIKWPEPHTFKGDRYLKSSRTETKVNPWPTLCHAQPIGTIDDMETYKRSHMCVMARLNYHVMMEFIRMMVELPRYDLDVKSDESSMKDMFTRKAASKIAFRKG